MYTCKYFKIAEIVKPSLVEAWDEALLWEIFDERVLRAADFIREHWGVTTCNTGKLINCGLRSFNDVNYPIFSPHKFGRALDLHILEIEDKHLHEDDKIKQYNDLRDDLIHNDNVDMAITFEGDISWLHIDTYNRGKRIWHK
ncbi:hypothetical protein AGMMS49573_11050 [Endomicrobiia bacterium]|nr:hypothetical protein AGMMS49573_11050 [Endomicrobiia bacterium]